MAWFRTTASPRRACRAFRPGFLSRSIEDLEPHVFASALIYGTIFDDPGLAQPHGLASVQPPGFGAIPSNTPQAAQVGSPAGAAANSGLAGVPLVGASPMAYTNVLTRTFPVNQENVLANAGDAPTGHGDLSASDQNTSPIDRPNVTGTLSGMSNVNVISSGGQIEIHDTMQQNNSLTATGPVRPGILGVEVTSNNLNTSVLSSMTWSVAGPNGGPPTGTETIHFDASFTPGTQNGGVAAVTAFTFDSTHLTATVNGSGDLVIADDNPAGSPKPVVGFATTGGSITVDYPITAPTTEAWTWNATVTGTVRAADAGDDPISAPQFSFDFTITEN